MKLISLIVKSLAAVAMAGLLLVGSGCATSPQPARLTGDYSTTPLGPETFRISSQGGRPDSSARALDLALLRACQLPKEEALREQGFSHFAVVDEDSSSTGQMVYCAGLNHVEFKPERGLVVRYFTSKPKRMFSFDRGKLEKILDEKLSLGR